MRTTSRSREAPAQRAPDLSVVVPAFREALNLGELVQRLCAAFDAAGLDGEVIVVDDDSRDGTEELCRELARTHPVRLLVRRGERGLATAVVHGMAQARGRVLACMDADLSHPPECVPGLCRAVAEGECDIAIGSRYVAGGTIGQDWGLVRRFNSWVATSLALGLTRVRDPMAGFFAIRRDLFEDAPPLRPAGFKILLELLAKCPEARAKEFPIEFRDRKSGESKLDFKQQILYLRHLRRLYRFRYPVPTELLQYGLVGLSGLLVDVVLFSTLFRLVGFPDLASRAASFVVAASWNRAWNRRITFGGARSRWAGFLLVSALGFLVHCGVYYLLTRHVPFFRGREELALVAGVFPGFAFDYLGARLLVFDRDAVIITPAQPAPAHGIAAATSETRR